MLRLCYKIYERIFMCLHFLYCILNDTMFLIAVTIESLKLLCNLLFNSTKMQRSKVLISSLPYLIDRIKNYTDDVPNDVKLFDMRMLFLLTALNTSTRDIIKTDLCGDICLIKMIKKFATQSQNNETTVIKVQRFIISLLMCCSCFVSISKKKTQIFLYF